MSEKVLPLCLNPAFDPDITAELRLISKTLKQCIRNKCAIAVIGSYGRGEGAAIINSGRVTPANDYDIAIITLNKLSLIERKQLKQIKVALTTGLKLKHLDLNFFTTAIYRRSPQSMMEFDLQHGSQFLLNELGELICAAPQTSPPFHLEEIRNLLINRMVTLLEGIPPESTAESLKNSSRQVAKVIFAIVDYTLFEAGRYITSYQSKKTALLEVCSQNDPLRRLTEWAWDEFACLNNSTILNEGMLREHWNVCSQLMQEKLILISSKLDNHPYKTISELLPNWRGKSSITRLFREFVACMQLKHSRFEVESEIALYLTRGIAAFNFSTARPLIDLWYKSI